LDEDEGWMSTNLIGDDIAPEGGGWLLDWSGFLGEGGMLCEGPVRFVSCVPQPPSGGTRPTHLPLSTRIAFYIGNRK